MKTNVVSYAAAAVLGLSALFCSPAQAQMRSGATDHLGFYVAAGAGRAKHDTFCGDRLNQFAFAGPTCDDDDLTWNASVGAQVHRNFAMELGYVDLGKASVTGSVGGVATSIETKIKGVQVSILGIIPVTAGFSVYGRVGLLGADRDNNATGAVRGNSGRDSSAVIGIGLRYDFSRYLAVRAEWQEYFDFPVKTIGAALIWKF